MRRNHAWGPDQTALMAHLLSPASQSPSHTAGGFSKPSPSQASSYCDTGLTPGMPQKPLRNELNASRAQLSNHEALHMVQGSPQFLFTSSRSPHASRIHAPMHPCTHAPMHPCTHAGLSHQGPCSTLHGAPSVTLPPQRPILPKSTKFTSMPSPSLIRHFLQRRPPNTRC
jgi:hypothetical protein